MCGFYYRLNTKCIYHSTLYMTRWIAYIFTCNFEVYLCNLIWNVWYSSCLSLVAWTHVGLCLMYAWTYACNTWNIFWHILVRIRHVLELWLAGLRTWMGIHPWGPWGYLHPRTTQQLGDATHSPASFVVFKWHSQNPPHFPRKCVSLPYHTIISPFENSTTKWCHTIYT
jgi:hypothetical protein